MDQLPKGLTKAESTDKEHTQTLTVSERMPTYIIWSICNVITSSLWKPILDQLHSCHTFILKMSPPASAVRNVISSAHTLEGVSGIRYYIVSAGTWRSSKWPEGFSMNTDTKTTKVMFMIPEQIVTSKRFQQNWVIRDHGFTKIHSDLVSQKDLLVLFSRAWARLSNLSLLYHLFDQVSKARALRNLDK